MTRFLIRAPKVYSGEIRFGITTDTYDRHGKVVAESPVDHLDPEQVLKGMQELVGTFAQSAPPYSAKKHQGVKYYELARRGQEVPEASKEISVFDFEPLGEIGDQTLTFSLSC